MYYQLVHVYLVTNTTHKVLNETSVMYFCLHISVTPLNQLNFIFSFPVSSPTVVHPDTTSPPEGNGGVVAGVIVALVVIALVIILVVVIAYFLYR